MSIMDRRVARAAGALAVSAAMVCAGAPQRAAAQDAPLPIPARADSGRRPYTAADVTFMSGMIVHHAQAVAIGGWAPTHGASPAVQRLCERIVVGQEDEIAILRRWLVDRGEPVPGADSSAHTMHHATDMPGMLSPDELAQLDGARGAAFDRLFLTLMIRHHQGALVMVERLLGAQGAGQDQTVFRIASDVHADQSTEIHRMQQMLAALPPEGQGP
jgi:uncharacterized protein (DUF305 family)